MMYVSGKFNNETIAFSEKEEHNEQIHDKTNNAFRLSESITKSDHPAKMLNAALTNGNIFSFSFVRHPYTR